MAQVTVKINGYSYVLGCEDGQEAHLLAMAEQIEARVENAKALGQSGEAKLLVLAALLMADELHDLKMEAEAPGANRLKAPPAPERAEGGRLGMLAARAENIAAALEST